MPGIRALSTAAAAGLFALGVGGAAHAVSSAPAARPTVSLSSTKLGSVLVDRSGRTLYLFQADKHGKSTCAGACAGVWPPYTVSGKATAGKGLSARKLTLVKRADGKRQVRYNGHPLYRYSGDSKRGDTAGEGITGFGAKWYAVSASGRRVLPGQSGQQPVPAPAPYSY